MKKTVSPFLLFATTCLAFALGVSHSFAQVAPKQPPLSNVDKRVDGKKAAQLSPAREAALANLRGRLPGLKAEIDPVLKSPNYLSSSKGFLSGPDGKGRGISADVAKGFSQDDPHRAIKGFLNEHRQAFNHGAEVLVDAKIKREFAASHSGLKTMVWQQQLEGVPVFEALLIRM